MKSKYLSLCAIAMGLVPAAMAQPVSENADMEAVMESDATVSEASGTSLKPEVKKNKWINQVKVTGSLQTEFLIPVTDNGLGNKHTDRDIYAADVLNNTYFDLTINAPYVSIGGRFQWAKWPLPGFEKDFDGWGVPYFWATGRYKWASLTAGDFYEQFGSGLILRTYEERSLGIDNAIRGGRLKLNPVSGVSFTALGGKQRRYWEHNSSWLWGADAEWSLNESFKSAFSPDYGVMLGFSYVGKHESDDTPQYVVETQNNTPEAYRLRMPENNAAFDGRVKLRLHDFNVLAEVATKNNDPSADNNYTYRRGSAVLLSGTYSTRGFSALLQAKRSDNMSYRSKRSMTGISSFVNHLPAFTLTQTYALAAMYPYATQADGEWAFQGEVRYTVKRGTPFGGRYGMPLRISASYISGLDRHFPAGVEAIPSNFIKGSDGYGAAFWKIGSLYYADLNFEANRKFNKNFQLTLFYMYQRYNQKIVEGHGVNGDIVNSNIFILEGQHKISKKLQLRWEAQYLQTKQDLGDWATALVELSFAPHWMVTIQDMQNFTPSFNKTENYRELTNEGRDIESAKKAWDKKRNKNYYNFGVTYTYRSNRFTLAYGRTREGYNCSGGVCRWVPASKGFTITYNYKF